MFVSDSEPLSGVPVRLSGGDDLFVTDDEGKVELDLDLGTHTFEVQIGEEWVERTVHRQGHAPLFVVNVSSSNQPNVSTLNTLQIDLANLVGDRYVFETVLGRGGMGVVVKAIDRMLNRPVAIKMLSDELRENEEAQQIFLVEARNLATLSHPNLVAIHDILNVGGRVLMVFEYVLGENVEKKIKKNGRLDQKEVLRIAIQLTRCVSYLHEHDLIHRDLKPANIIMQADGTLKLIDFGLARSLNELYIRGTRVRGTPAYMAPEQIQGIHLTTATDLYQIGISMYEMLTAKLPFATGDMAYAHVHLDAPPMREKFGDIDEELEALVLQCLSKNAKNRPASAEALLEALQGVYARLANRESNPIPLRDPTNTGPFERAPSSPAMPMALAPSPISEFEFDEPEGSNWPMYAAGAVGVLALVIAGFLLLRSPDTVEPVEATPAEPEPVAAAIVEPDPLPAADPEESVATAIDSTRNFVSLGVAMASSQATGIAQARTDATAEAPTRRTASSKRRQNTAGRREPAQVKAAPPREQEPAKPAKPKKSALAPTTTEKNSDLLSVEGSSTKSLLPVSD